MSKALCMRASLLSASAFWFISRTFNSLPRNGKTLVLRKQQNWQQAAELSRRRHTCRDQGRINPPLQELWHYPPSVKISVHSCAKPIEC